LSAPVALITGASRGIGKRIAIDLAESGYDLVLTARSSKKTPGRLPGTLEDTATQVENWGRKALVSPLDVRDECAIASLAEQVDKVFGRCDLLVNNAALAPPKPALKDSTKRWRMAIDANINGPFYISYYFVPLLEKNGLGRIVNISSQAATMPDFQRISYTTTKAALEGMTRAMAFDLKGSVAVNCIRLEIPVWTEGFAATLPPESALGFEHPVIMSDAVRWLAESPITFTGRVLTIGDLRARGAVRAFTPASMKDL